MEKEEEKSVESKLIEIEPQSEAAKPDEKPAAEEEKKEPEPENDEDATKVEEKRLLESEPHKLENIEEAKEESLIEIDVPKVEVKLNKSDEKQVEVEIGELAKDIENKIDDNKSLKKSKSGEKINFGEDDKNKDDEKKPPSPKHHHHHHGILHPHSNEPHINLHPEFVDLPTSDNEGDVKKPLLVRRNTIVEETEESLRQARKSIAESASRKSSIKQDWGDIKRDLYNSEYREFLSRDCFAWFKLSMFYFIFYVCLAGFFILLLYLFYEFRIDPKTPNFFYKESVMHYRGINPGLGFRPQVDIESELISVSEKEAKNNIQSLNLFLGKYDRNKAKNFTGAHGRKQTFNYEDIIKNTPCSRENDYGYHTKSPCVIVKLNRIYGWLPTASAKMPANLTKITTTDKFVYVKCKGEQGVDRDNLHEIDYYSAYPNREIGGIPFRYFPYRNQPDYLSPLVFVHFKNITLNVLINVECKAYANNIDNKDRLNRRGMTRIQLYAS